MVPLKQILKQILKQKEDIHRKLVRAKVWSLLKKKKKVSPGDE
jgi:hypothetical protein